MLFFTSVGLCGGFAGKTTSWAGKAAASPACPQCPAIYQLSQLHLPSLPVALCTGSSSRDTPPALGLCRRGVQPPALHGVEQARQRLGEGASLDLQSALGASLTVYANSCCFVLIACPFRTTAKELAFQTSCTILLLAAQPYLQVHTELANAEAVRTHGGILAMHTRPPLPARLTQLLFQVGRFAAGVTGDIPVQPCRAAVSCCLPVDPGCPPASPPVRTYAWRAETD